MRCHSQALTIKLTRDVPLDEIADVLGRANEWVRLVPNDKASTLAGLSPAAVSGTLNVPIGRLRKMQLGPTYLSAFTVGDQLLWGAAEPLRRMLRILAEHRSRAVADRFNILLVGHGRLGQLIAAAAPQAGATIAGTIDDTNAGDLADRARWRDVDVAIDASAPDAFVANLPALCALGCSLVVGTTGWQAHAGDVRRQIDAAGIGAVVTANFSVGATLMDALTERAAKLFAPQDLYGAFVHETHHAAKKDAPSGTALLLKGALERGGFPRPIDVASTRVGFVPGIHTVGFDGPAETITLTHTVRDRATFAHGALVAARWVRGRRGWFTMRDVLEI